MKNSQNYTNLSLVPQSDLDETDITNDFLTKIGLEPWFSFLKRSSYLRLQETFYKTKEILDAPTGFAALKHQRRRMFSKYVYLWEELQTRKEFCETQFFHEEFPVPRPEKLFRDCVFCGNHGTIISKAYTKPRVRCESCNKSYLI